MGRLIRLGALACLYLGAESKALKWQNDSPSWVPPRETMAAMDMNGLGFSPNPTAAPDPANVDLRLAKRVRGDNTCGYMDGVSSRSIYCEVGSCVVHSFYSVVGCCNSAAVSDCKIATGCLPATSSRFYSSSDSLMLFCSSVAQPECMTYVYSGSAYRSYTLFNCGPTEARVVVYANPTDGPSTDGPSMTHVSDDMPTQAGTVTMTASQTPGPTSAAPDSGSSAPVGAIVGGVVGGVAAIALIVFGIIFLVRKGKNKDPNNNGQAPPGAYNGPPPGDQPGQQPQMYQVPPAQQPSPNGYTPTTPGSFPSGFTPVDNRQSMLKQPYNVTTTGGISPPASPSPTYQSSVPQYVQGQDGITPPQGGYPPPQGGYPPPQGGYPPPQGGYPPPQQQQQQQQQQGGYYNVPPTAQGQQQQQTTPPTHHTHHHHHQSFASELPAARGDGELRELA